MWGEVKTNYLYKKNIKSLSTKNQTKEDRKEGLGTKSMSIEFTLVLVVWVCGLDSENM